MHRRRGRQDASRCSWGAFLFVALLLLTACFFLLPLLPSSDTPFQEKGKELTAVRIYTTRKTEKGAQRQFGALKDAFASYGGEVSLSVTTESNAVQTFVQQQEWPAGVVQLAVSSGLPFSWDADRDAEVALMLAEDTVVEAHHVQWLQQALQGAQKAGHKLMGVFLQGALQAKDFPEGEVPPKGPFLVEAPCSSGCVLFPGPWRQFRAYSSLRGELDLPPVSSRHVALTWQRHMLEMMHARGLLMLHPPLQETPRSPSLPPLSALPLFDTNLRACTSAHLLSSGVLWARKPLLQTAFPKQQALAKALYGAPWTPQCLLDECTTPPQRNHEERFLLYSPQFGLSNQLLAYADMTVLATTLNRTLVLPPLRQKDGTFLPVESLFDMEQLFYFPHKNESGGGKVRAILHDDFIRLVMRGQPLDSLVRFDWSDRFGGREKDDLWFTKNALLDKRTRELTLPTLAMSRPVMKLLWGGCSSHKVLALDIGFLASTWRQKAAIAEPEYDALRSGLQAWIHRPFQNRIVDQVSAAVAPLQPFSCLHLRRGDFAGYCAMIRDSRKADPLGPYGGAFFSTFNFRNCYPRLPDLALVLNASGVLPMGQQLYIATNEPDRDLLSLHFGDAFDWLDLQHLRSIAPGLPAALPAVLLDRLVCQHADVFVGTWWSTFSRSIVQSGPSTAHYIGFGPLQLIARPEDDPDLLRLRALHAPFRFETRQQAVQEAFKEEGASGFRIASLPSSPPRVCTQESEKAPRYWSRKEFWRSRLARHKHDVTLVTFARGPAHLPMLRRLLRGWGGVVSLTYCASSADDVSSQLAALRHLAVETEAAGRARLDVGLLSREPIRNEGNGATRDILEQGGRSQLGKCAIGALLDLALDAAMTDLVVLVDPWVQPSPGLYATLSLPRAYQALRKSTQNGGWLAVPVKDTKSDQVVASYVLAARQHVPCPSHLAAADDEASAIARHLAKIGSPAATFSAGYFVAERSSCHN